jgi:hypothetical protein
MRTETGRRLGEREQRGKIEGEKETEEKKT